MIGKTLNEREFCEAVGISRITAWRMRNDGRLPHLKIGRRILFRPEHIEAFLRQFERNAQPGNEGLALSN